MSSKNPNATPLSSKPQERPEILKSWRPKLLVLLLCAVSFYAGWQASRSYLVKECYGAGGQASVKNSLVICQLP